jgi:hypothetical protein
VTVVEPRVNKAFEANNRLTTARDASVPASHLNLKLQELYVVQEFQEKVQGKIQKQMREKELA